MVALNMFKKKKSQHHELDEQHHKEEESVTTNNNPQSGSVSANLDDVINQAVDTSISMNGLFIGGINANQTASELDSQVNSISSAIEEMSSTINLITDNTSQALEHTKSSQQSATKGHEVSEKSMDTMNSIHSSVDETMEKVLNLSESSKQIEGIITQIQMIAEQTNLLALNATIEAARAGEAGKGFAVVAGEVKNLASQTGKSTQEISDIIGKLVVSIQEIVDAMQSMSLSVESGKEVSVEVKTCMQEINENATQVNSLMDSISQALQENNQAISEVSISTSSVLECSQKSRDISAENANITRLSSENIEELIKELSGMTESKSGIIIKLAKSDHIVWKRKLTQLIIGNEELCSSEINDHKNCRLGRWYYSSAAQDASHLSAYKKLEAPHMRIHAAGIKAFKLYSEGDHKGALAALEEMEELSMEVLKLLDEIDQYIHSA